MRKRPELSRTFSLLNSWMKTSMFRRSCSGGAFWMPAKNWSYRFFSRRMSSSSFSSGSSSTLIGINSRGHMPKAASPAMHSALRNLPSMERILTSGAFAQLIGEFGRDRVRDAATAHLALLRQSATAYDERAAAAAVQEVLSRDIASSLRRVISGSGVIIHTNLGRSPIDPEILSEAQEIVRGYSNREFDLVEGERGARARHLG